MMLDRLAADNDGTDAAAGSSPVDIRTLVTDHHREVFRYAYRLVGRQDDAEDLTQQTFMLAQQRLSQLRHPDRARGWLFAILRNCYRKAVSRPVPLAATGLALDVDSIPDTVAGQTFDQETLQAALDALSDEFKLVVVMFYFEQRSYKEIAEQLQIPIGTVMSRLTRAKSRLRACLLNPSDHSQGRRGTAP